MRRTAFVLAVLAAAFGLGRGRRLRRRGRGDADSVDRPGERVDDGRRRRDDDHDDRNGDDGNGDDETTPTPQGDAAAGKAVFAGSAGCTGCHTLERRGRDGHRRAEPRRREASVRRRVGAVMNGGARCRRSRGR